MGVRKASLAGREPESLFLATKIAVPKVQPRWIDRARLIEKLGVPPAARVTILHAGPGFGKTACLALWHRALVLAGHKVAWYSIETGDNDLSTFVGYLAAAIYQVDGAIGGEVMELSRAGSQLSPSALVTRLLNRIAASPDRYVLVLDDYHFVHAPAIDEAMSHLLIHAPDNLAIIVASRGLPELRLAKLRAEGLVAEIGPEQLGLTRAETGTFAQASLGVELPARDVAQLQNLSEGWPAALQMMLAAMHNKKHLHELVRGFTGETKVLRDYLAQEAFEGLPEATQQFLLRSSVLDRFCTDLCEQVTGIPDAAGAIANVEQRQLLVQSLDEQGRWFRYHALFAEFLQARLRVKEPGAEPVLHRRASAWFEGNGLWVEAVRHALQAGDESRALDIIDRCAMTLVENGEYMTLLGWIARLGEDAVRPRYRLRVAQAWAFGLTMRTAEAKAIRDDLLKAELPGPAIRATVEAEMSLLLAGAAMIEDDFHDASFIESWAPRVVGATPWMRDIYSTLATYSLTLRGEYARARSFPPTETPLKIVYQKMIFGIACWREGAGAEADRAWTDAIDYADGEFGAHSVSAALARALSTRINYERGQAAEVQEALAERLEIIEQTAPLEWLWSAYSTLAFAHIATGKRDEAAHVLERGRMQGQARGWARLEAAMTVNMLRFADRYTPDGYAALLARLEELAAKADRDSVTGLETALMCEVGIGFWYGMTRVGSDGRARIERALGEIGSKGAAPLRAQALLMLAQVLNESGDTDAAVARLNESLLIGEKLRLAQTYRDAGPEVLALVRKIAMLPPSATVPSAGYLAMLAGDRPAVATSSVPKEQAAARLIEDLSEREREILMLVGRGMSNKEVGRNLRIGPETVKWHLKNLFAKLGVPNRIQAINRARSLEMLS